MSKFKEWWWRHGPKYGVPVDIAQSAWDAALDVAAGVCDAHGNTDGSAGAIRALKGGN